MEENEKSSVRVVPTFQLVTAAGPATQKENQDNLGLGSTLLYGLKKLEHFSIDHHRRKRRNEPIKTQIHKVASAGKRVEQVTIAFGFSSEMVRVF